MSETRLHYTKVIIRLAGRHQTEVKVIGKIVQLLMPGAIIHIRDREAAESLWKVWVDVARALPKIFAKGAEAPGYPIPSAEGLAYVSLEFAGPVQGRDILGKTGIASPSGCGEMKVRLGALLIICDDRAAAETQIAAWRTVDELARKNLPRQLPKGLRSL